MATATHTTDDPSTRVDVRARLSAIDRELAGLAEDLVPERIPSHVVNRVVGLLGRIERRAGGARLVLADAAAKTGAWKAAGARSPEEYAAQQNGTTVGESKADLEASGQLAHLPAARDAVASGDLSTAKAKAVASGATADPAAERSLLEKAAKGDLQDVRDEARRVRQRVDEGDGKVAERMYRRRSLKTWLSLDGGGHGHWDVPPEYQAWFLAALEPYREEAFRLARESGLRPPPEALMADALFMLARDVLADLDLPTPPPPPHRPDHRADPAATPRQRHGTTGGVSPDDPCPAAAPSGGSDSTGAPEQAGCPPERADTGRDDPASPAASPTGGDPAASDARPVNGDGRPAAPSLFGYAPDDERGGGPRSPEPDPDPDPPDPAPPNRRSLRLDQPRRAGGNRRAPAQIVVHVDYAALARGFAAEGEMCEIVGIGPVPVALARHMAADAVLRVILTGTDVTVINSERRYIPAALRRALEARDRQCVVPGCHVRHHLEIDHTHDFALGGPTSLANTARLCKRHHDLKTYCGWKLLGGPAAWRLEPP